MLYLESHFNEINVAQNFDPLRNSLCSLFKFLNIQCIQNIRDLPTKQSKCCLRLTCYDSRMAYLAFVLISQYLVNVYNYNA